ncbi:MAG: amidohydrolase family protein [Acidobacteriia bacterium]|nr:amidohydrolase family protein [Terriglobia bacterium]
MAALRVLFLLAGALSAQTLDLVFNQARVMDPLSGLDAIRHVGVRGGRIAVISKTPLEGRRVIDASGLVLAPGFIDLHAHGQDLENQRLQAMDGVTTALELEVGSGDVETWYREREGKRLIHSGVSAGHVPARMRVLKDGGTGFVPSGEGARRAATEEEITAMKRSIERGLQQGGVGVGFGIQYTPAASRWEILEMFRVAARFGAPAFVHIRHMGQTTPDALTAVEEVIAAAAITGIGLHIVHITSSGLGQAPQLLQTIGEARARGLPVTTECYPYNAAMTELQSVMFDPGWQKVLGIDVGSLEWAATGERLTAESFPRLRKQGGMVIMHMIPDNVMRLAVASPGVLIASDGVIQGGKGHPRGAGTFARVLGRFVREQKALSLMDALAKMSLLPAQRLEQYVPEMANKGRLHAGADADLVVFDAARIEDRATFAQPDLASAGVRYLVVGGALVVEESRLNGEARPGRAVRARIQ